MTTEFIKSFPQYFCSQLAKAYDQEMGYFSLSANDFLGQNGWASLKLAWPVLDALDRVAVKVNFSYLRPAVATKSLPTAPILTNGRTNDGEWVSFSSNEIPLEEFFAAGYIAPEFQEGIVDQINNGVDLIRLIAGPDAFFNFTLREIINPAKPKEPVNMPLGIENVEFCGFSLSGSASSLRGFGNVPRPAQAPKLAGVNIKMLDYSLTAQRVKGELVQTGVSSSELPEDLF